MASEKSEKKHPPGTTINGRTWDGNQWRALGGICVGPPMDVAPVEPKPFDEQIAELDRSLDATIPRASRP